MFKIHPIYQHTFVLLFKIL